MLLLPYNIISDIAFNNFLSRSFPSGHHNIATIEITPGGEALKKFYHALEARNFVLLGELPKNVGRTTGEFSPAKIVTFPKRFSTKIVTKLEGKKFG
jgi:hypothetical protein